MENRKTVFKLYERGVKLYICGVPATPQMVEGFMQQNSDCMPKISFNEKGDISEINYT